MVTQTDSIAATSAKSMSNGGKVLTAVTGGIGLGISIVCASFVAPAFRRFCLPYVPSTAEQVRNVLHFIPRNSAVRVLDIGSGDGRIVIATAQHGVKYSHGVELNPWLVWYSRFAALRHGVYSKTEFICKDLWKFDLKPYDYVIIFGVEQMMNELGNKLISQAPHLKVIACRYPLPNVKPLATIDAGLNTVWFYNLSENNPNSQRS
uniref:Methyltransferase domain-containing protein n=1 Tax=Glossina brevipalpis TaxID=37001 RepID=A0A1A9WY16_9MUSC